MEEIVWQKTKIGLQRKLASGAVTQEDVETARDYAKKFSAPSNIALYASVKRAANERHEA